MNWPLNNPTITQPFGANPEDYVRFGYPAHNGLDLWTADAPPTVFAIAAGSVEKVGWEPDGYGKYVVTIQEDLWRAYYAHLDTVYLRPGENVLEGLPVGLMGSTGNVTGPHLHLGIRFPVEIVSNLKSEIVNLKSYKGFIDPLPILRGEPPPVSSSSSNAPLPVGEGQGMRYSLPGSVIVKVSKGKTIYRMRRYF